MGPTSSKTHITVANSGMKGIPPKEWLDAYGVVTSPEREKVKLAPPGGMKYGFPDGTVNIGGMLGQLGYQTAHIGKWHVGPEYGFDELKSCPGSTPAGGVKSDCNYGMTGRKQKVSKALTELTVTKIKAFAEVAGKDEAPFFIHMSNYEVHTPISPYPEYLNNFKAKRKADKSFDHFSEVYATMIQALDESVHKVMNTLRATGVENNTLILFASDNGGISSLTPSVLAGTKGNLFEGGIRIPFIVHWPGTIAAGTEIAGNYGFVDLLPTLADLAGANMTNLSSYLGPGQPVDGVSMVPALLNDRLVPHQVQVDQVKSKNQEWHRLKEQYVAPMNDRALVFHAPVFLNPYTSFSKIRFGRQYAPFGLNYDDILEQGGKWRTVPSSALIRGVWKLLVVYGPETQKNVLYNLENDPTEREPLMVLETTAKTLNSSRRSVNITHTGGNGESYTTILLNMLDELETHLIHRRAPHVFSHSKPVPSPDGPYVSGSFLPEPERHNSTAPQKERTEVAVARTDTDAMKMVPRFIFVKTHKTASSTITSILHNMVVRYNLKVVPVDWKKYTPGRTWTCENLKSAFNGNGRAKMIYSDIWCNHFEYSVGQWEQPERDCLDEFVRGGQHMTIFRKPVERQISAYQYFKRSDFHGVNCSYAAFKKKYLSVEMKGGGLRNNELCVSLGVNTKDVVLQEKQIDRVVNTWDILFAEDLEESLYWWRAKHNLTFEDIYKHDMKTHVPAPCDHGNIVTAADRAHIEYINSCDVKLYAAAWKKWEDIKATQEWERPEPDFTSSACINNSSDLCLSTQLDNKFWLEKFNDKYGLSSSRF